MSSPICIRDGVTCQLVDLARVVGWLVAWRGVDVNMVVDVDIVSRI